MINPSLNNFPGADWQTLGKLELPVESSADGAINEWLMKILDPLNLDPDFLNKILKSAEEAASRVLQSGGALMELGHIHFLIFAPDEPASTGQTWGFFRIEKIESPKQDKTYSDHSVEFYLYLEGQ